MSTIDNVIHFMAEHHATAFHIPAGQRMLLEVAGNRFPQRQTFSAEQLAALIQESAPPAFQSRFQSHESFDFPYTSPDGIYRVKVQQAEGVLELIILPEPLQAPAQTPSQPPAQAPAEAKSPAEARTPTDARTPTEAKAPTEGKAPPVATRPAQPASVREVRTGNARADQVLNVPLERRGTRQVEHLDELFRLLKEIDASDLHCACGEYPIVRVYGAIYKMFEYEKWTAESLQKLLWEVAPERNQEEWKKTHDTDYSYSLEGTARFRCNIYSDRHGIAAQFRLIPSQVSKVEELKLPQSMVNLCYLSKGLVIVTGPTGSGKSTTLAALVDHCNRIRTDHIITIEDPIEFVHENIRCLVHQREVHTHTKSFARALRAALREDPDVVLVGEMRDLETVAIAIETAETGHLVFGTLHTSSAATTVDRVVDQFPSAQQEQIRVMLSESLSAVVSQMLFKKKTGGRIAAWEVLLCPPAVSNLIRERKTYQLTSMMQINHGKGMCTMNDAVMDLIRDDIIEPMEAYTKVIDKAGLISLFEKEGIPFQPPTQELLQ